MGETSAGPYRRAHLLAGTASLSGPLARIDRPIQGADASRDAHRIVADVGLVARGIEQATYREHFINVEVFQYLLTRPGPTMDLFSRDVLQNLAETRADVCVSIFMPTQRVEAEFSQNPIRLKNLLREAKNQLAEDDTLKAAPEELLEPAVMLLENTPYWRGVSDGFAAFLTPSSAEFFRLPVNFDELVVTGNRFHVKPLFPLIAGNNRFYLLAVSQKNVRFFQGTHFSINPLNIDGMPRSLADALYYDEPEKQLQHHTAVKKSAGKDDTIYHGQGRQSEDQRSRPQDALRRYFRQVDEALHDTLQDESAPLVLAGVEYYLPIYREANSYQHFIGDEIVTGNPDDLTPKELHNRAWEVVEPHFLEEQEQSVEAFNQQFFNGNGLASADLEEIVPAAAYGRVDALFVSIGSLQWGRFDEEQSTVELHEKRQPGDDDLLDLAAVYTYLHGGKVYALQQDNMPVDTDVAATFRYALDATAAEVR